MPPFFFFEGNIYKMWVQLLLCGNMSVATLSSRGRLTLPAEVRSKVKATKFLVVLEGNSIRLIPLPDPLKLKGSIKIPWSIEELEEAGEEFVFKRVEG